MLSACYVGFATIALFAMCPESFLHGEWALMSLLVTFPVAIISFGLIYSGIKCTVIILVVQLVMFLLTWYLLYISLKNRGYE